MSGQNGFSIIMYRCYHTITLHKQAFMHHRCIHHSFNSIEPSLNYSLFTDVMPGSRTRENFGRGKDWQILQIVSYSPKLSSLIFTDTPKIYLAYALTVAYLPSFCLPIAFTNMVCQKFHPPNNIISHVQYLRKLP